MSEDATRCYLGNVPLQDVKIRPADGRAVNAYNSVCVVLNRRGRHLLPTLASRTAVDKCHHGDLRFSRSSCVQFRRRAVSNVGSGLVTAWGKYEPYERRFLRDQGPDRRDVCLLLIRVTFSNSQRVLRWPQELSRTADSTPPSDSWRPSVGPAGEKRPSRTCRRSNSSRMTITNLCESTRHETNPISETGSPPHEDS